MSEPHRNPKTGMLYYRRIVPERLRTAVGKREIKISLGTKDPREAKRRYPDTAARAEVILASAGEAPAMFGMLSVFADFERVIIRERIMSGLTRAREKGDVVIGRPRVEASKEARIRKALESGTGIIKTAKLAGVGVSVVQRVKAAMAA